MSVYERTDVEHKGTDEVTDLERSVGGALVDTRGGGGSCGERHAWRILAAYRKEGAAALAHGNRGRLPLNAMPASIRQQVVAIAQGRYSGINQTHLAELLAEWGG